MIAMRDGSKRNAAEHEAFTSQLENHEIRLLALEKPRTCSNCSSSSTPTRAGIAGRVELPLGFSKSMKMARSASAWVTWLG